MPYWTRLCLTGPVYALLDPSMPYWTRLCLTGPGYCKADAKFTALQLEL